MTNDKKQLKVFDYYKDNVHNWSSDRDLYDYDNGSTPVSQLFKVAEELGELHAGILKDNKEMTKDGIGDTIIATINFDEVVNRHGFNQIESISKEEHKLLLALCEIGEMSKNILLKRQDLLEAASLRFTSLIRQIEKDSNFVEHECVDYAWNIIKSRKGLMINRNFVKYDDLQQHQRDNIDKINQH